jgi:predicted nucleic acid-binding protein
VKTRYLLDTSALLAHLLQEAGADIVDHCLETSGGRCAVCVITWVEFEIFLKRSAYSGKETAEILAIYHAALGEPIPVDGKVGREALAIRDTVAKRIHLTDLLIAACAKAHGCHLVYRDKHIEGINADVLPQIKLPAK